MMEWRDFTDMVGPEWLERNLSKRVDELNSNLEAMRLMVIHSAQKCEIYEARIKRLGDELRKAKMLSSAVGFFCGKCLTQQEEYGTMPPSCDVAECSNHPKDD